MKSAVKKKTLKKKTKVAARNGAENNRLKEGTDDYGDDVNSQE